MTAVIRFNEVYRDAIQSLMGTNPSADEIIKAHPNAHRIGTATIQTGGGTFFDIFAQKGRNEWVEVEKLISHFRKLGVRQTALFRGDFLLGYKAEPFDVVHAMVREYARMGMNVLLNFHGLNDTSVTAGVAEAVRRVKADEGHDITAQGTICIEDNRNITIDGCLRVAAELLKTGHEGFYLKSASGRLSPDFVYELTEKLIEEFGNQQIDVHAHSTYGDAPICLMAAIEAGIERGHSIGIDVQHPALSGSTAHPNMLRMLSLIKDHPNEAVRAAAPTLDYDAIKADAASLHRLRFQYRGFESAYNHELQESMRAVRAPGGATSTLKSTPGLIENLTIQMQQKIGREPTWNEIQIAIYETQAKIDDALGQPTQVTPYAFNTTLQAAISLSQMLMGKDIWHVLIPETKNYLAGRFGAVPDTVNPDLQARALKELGIQEVEAYVPSLERPYGALEEAKQLLRDAGIAEPTNRQAISVNTRKRGLEHVVSCAERENKPNPPAKFPDYAYSAGINGHRINQKGAAEIVKALGGIEKLEHISQLALFLKQLDDNLNPFPKGMEWKRGDWHKKITGELTEFMSSIHERLKEAGFRGFVERFPSDFARQWTLQKVEEILRDVLDHRGTGLFNHMMKAIHGPDHQHLYRSPDFKGWETRTVDSREAHIA